MQHLDYELERAFVALMTVGERVVTFVSTTAAGLPADHQDIWWTPGESGHGVAMIQHGRNLFLAWYLYDSAGKPQWVVLPEGSWNSALSEFTGALYLPSGAPFAQYDERRFSANAPVGSATLRFAGADAATLSFTINGIAGSKPLVRFPFGSASSTAPGGYGDLWWGGTGNNGWGISISQQSGMLFIAWYTYDAAGRPQWFVAPAGSWLGSTWTADVYRTAGSPVVGAVFDPSRVTATRVGTLALRFGDANRASMRFDVDGQRGQFALTRLGF